LRVLLFVLVVLTGIATFLTILNLAWLGIILIPFFSKCDQVPFIELGHRSVKSTD